MCSVLSAFSSLISGNGEEARIFWRVGGKTVSNQWNEFKRKTVLSRCLYVTFFLYRSGGKM